MTNDDIDTIKITKAADGTITLSGISGSNLGSILTAASMTEPSLLMLLTGDDDAEMHANNVAICRNHLDRQLHVDILQTKLREAIEPHFTPATLERDLTNIRTIHAGLESRLDDAVSETEASATSNTPITAGKVMLMVAHMMRRRRNAMRQAATVDDAQRSDTHA